jgi:chromatin structure-remodeling complex subunit RSC9
MVKAFLLHPGMPSALKLLVTLILREQEEEIVSIDLLSEPIRTAPALAITRRQCELTSDELDRIAKTTEPERSYEWYETDKIEFEFLFYTLTGCARFLSPLMLRR